MQRHKAARGPVALLTGFEPYGGRRDNPSAEVARALDGARISGHTVVGRILPVALAGLAERLDALLDETRPALVIATGLAPGEPCVRLERVGTNIADFDIADNAGHVARDGRVVPGGPDALLATLPLRPILEALLAAGIPARLSDTAGTYLCNATLYALLLALTRRESAVPCGFIHLPYAPAQVEGLLTGRTPPPEGQLPSMAVATMIEAVRIALALSAAPAGAARRPARRAASTGTGRRA